MLEKTASAERVEKAAASMGGICEMWSAEVGGLAGEPEGGLFCYFPSADGEVGRIRRRAPAEEMKWAATKGKEGVLPA